MDLYKSINNLEAVASNQKIEITALQNEKQDLITSVGLLQENLA